MKLPAVLLLFLLGFPPLAASKQPPKTYSIPLPPKTDFSDLDWLVGDWSGKTTEKSPPGDVRLSVAYGLDSRFLIFHETVTLASTGSTAAVDESWMGVLSGRPGGKEFTLRVFSSTGFITQYRVSVENALIRFVPEGGGLPPPGWLFRRMVTRSNPGELTESVEAAPPEGSFFQYYSAKLKHQPAATGPAPAPPANSEPAKAVQKPK
jgi:hypothetical protein